MRLLTWAMLAAVLLTTTGCPRKSRVRTADVPSKITKSDLRFVFFDLGQADAMLVLYKGHTLLMDAGEARADYDKYAAKKIGPALEALTGSRHLDALVVSHYHRDHVGDGTEATGIWKIIADGVTIDTLVDRGSSIFGEAGRGPTQQSYEAAIPGWISSGKVKKRRTVKQGDTLSIGEGLTIDVVAANGNEVLANLAKNDPDEIDSYPASENDYSVALKFTFGAFELFSGGDLTGKTLHRDFDGRREGYHDIESSTAERVGDVEVYRVNHHGSDHSSNRCFLKVLSPEVSIISSGENTYRHPAVKTFDRLIGLSSIYITGNADDRVRDHVERSIVGGDITILVNEDGSIYSVNGRDFRSLTEEKEAARPKRVERCTTQPLENPD